MKIRWAFCSLTLIVVALTFLQSAIAGPFYECRLGSEQKYQVNLCVDRCPEVGSQRGCSGNRTCCLVGCARICFHDRKTPVVPETEPLSATPVNSLKFQPSAMSYMRSGGDEFVTGSGDESTTIAATTNEAHENVDAGKIINMPIMTNELKETSHEILATTEAPAVMSSKAVDDAAGGQVVLGRLKFSSNLDKSISKDDLGGTVKQTRQTMSPVAKSFQQWNGVSDNINNALDDAQMKAGPDSATLWQIFEFLRIIQSKLDLISPTNTQTVGNQNANNVPSNWATLVGGVDAATSAVRSKPALSPNDPNILIRKSLSDFTKTLNKMQQELTTLSANQQQVVRILERVFVNQLRLANGAAAIAASTGGVSSGSAVMSQRINARQQRWQQQQQTKPIAPAISQLTPLAEAVLLDNAALANGDIASIDTSNCYRLNGCSFDVCRISKCEKYPEATCKINSCRQCQAEFFMGNTLVQCS